MAIGLEIGFEFFQNLLSGTTFIGSTLIIQFAIVMGTLLLISRKWTDWGELLFPVLLGWRIAGFHISGMFLSVSAVIFIISSLSTTEGGSVVGAVKNLVTPTGREKMKSEVMARQKGRLDIRNEMLKVKIGKKQEGLTAKREMLEAYKSKNKLNREYENREVEKNIADTQAKIRKANFEQYGTASSKEIRAIQTHNEHLKNMELKDATRAIRKIETERKLRKLNPLKATSSQGKPEIPATKAIQLLQMRDQNKKDWELRKKKKRGYLN